MYNRIYSIAKGLLPESVGKYLVGVKRKYRLQRVRTGTVDFGDLDRTTPISAIFGFDRGQAIDRYYIEEFLAANRQDITGRCLEMGDPAYTMKFGSGVSQPDVMHYVEGNPQATIVGDLTSADHIESNSFDCIIFTQSLQMIYDLKAALTTLHRILKPGGVLLMTSAGISKIARQLGEDDWGEYWHLTKQSAKALFDETFPAADVQVNSYGNVLSAISFLHGLAAEEIDREKLDYQDNKFEVLVVVRAVKQAET